MKKTPNVKLVRVMLDLSKRAADARFAKQKWVTISKEEIELLSEFLSGMESDHPSLVSERAMLEDARKHGKFRSGYGR